MNKLLFIILVILITIAFPVTLCVSTMYHTYTTLDIIDTVTGNAEYHNHYHRVEKGDQIIWLYESVNLPNIELYAMHRTIYTSSCPGVNEVTASGEPLQPGTAAINVRQSGGRWFYNSPLKMGDHIYLREMGGFVIRDTGPFTGNTDRDYWTVDLYLDITREEAIILGRELVTVKVLRND